MYRLVKRNKRLWIENDGVICYTPRDFLLPHIKNRSDFNSLLEDLNSGMSEIKAIVRFESKIRPCTYTEH